MCGTSPYQTLMLRSSAQTLSFDKELIWHLFKRFCGPWTLNRMITNGINHRRSWRGSWLRTEVIEPFQNKKKQHPLNKTSRIFCCPLKSAEVILASTRVLRFTYTQSLQNTSYFITHYLYCWFNLFIHPKRVIIISHVVSYRYIELLRDSISCKINSGLKRPELNSFGKFLESVPRVLI